ncbi:MAG: hypothetical protein KJO07_03690 [Deltaproteobacteria bacterium]|nr:hypothetical protein [Deltaproteobacteria bacterium]
MTDARHRLRILMIGAAVLFACSGMALAQDPVLVSYRAADVVYLDAGRIDGLTVGQRFSTDGAELSVIYLAGETAACRIVDESQPVRPGDSARLRLGAPAVLSWPSGLVVPAALAGTGTHVDPYSGPYAGPYAGPSIGPSIGPSTGPQRDPFAPIRPGLDPVVSTMYGARLDGSISLDWEVFHGDGRSADFERRVARLSLRARGLGGDAHEIRLRMSGQSYGSSSRDRIYEAAFSRRAEDGRVNFSLGRLAGGPRTGYGPLDGSLLEVIPLPGLAMGGFYGSSSDLSSFGFDESNRRYGVFVDYLNPNPEASRNVDLRMSGIREEILGQTSRDYLSFESRLGARDGRWSLHQSAELDFNTGWRREMSGRHVQLSNFSLRLARRLGESHRLSVSYDRFQLYRTLDTRWLRDELFDDRPRHALRANVSLGTAGGWRVSLGAGVRARDGDPDRSYSFTARARSTELTPWRLTLSTDLMAFANPLNDGYTARLRASRPFKGYRRLYVDLGRREWRGRFYDDAQSAHWLRVGSDVRLGRRLSVRGEYELSSGDALAGNRFLMGLRYRIRSNP